jgi:hypothetical protein
MQIPLNRRALAVSILPKFLQTGVIILTVFSTIISISLAKSTDYNSLTNNSITTNNLNDNNYNYKSIPIVMSTEDQTTTPTQDTEGEALYHDTIQREIEDPNRNPIITTPTPSISDSVNSRLVPTALVPPIVLIQPTMATIQIGGLTISVESTEQVRTTTGALYTKEIRQTYDNDKKGKLDLGEVWVDAV